VGTDERIYKNLKKQDGRCGPNSSSLEEEQWQALVNMVKMLGTSLPAEQLLAPQEGLGVMERVNYYIKPSSFKLNYQLEFHLFMIFFQFQLKKTTSTTDSEKIKHTVSTYLGEKIRVNNKIGFICVFTR
jgi:hypothetical protein